MQPSAESRSIALLTEIQAASVSIFFPVFANIGYHNFSFSLVFKTKGLLHQASYIILLKHHVLQQQYTAINKQMKSNQTQQQTPLQTPHNLHKSYLFFNSLRTNYTKRIISLLKLRFFCIICSSTFIILQHVHQHAYLILQHCVLSLNISPFSFFFQKLKLQMFQDASILVQLLI